MEARSALEIALEGSTYLGAREIQVWMTCPQVHSKEVGLIVLYLGLFRIESHIRCWRKSETRYCAETNI